MLKGSSEADANGLRHSCLKIIPTRPLRHVWPEVVMENHTHTPVVHGKSHTSPLYTSFLDIRILILM